MYFGHVRRCFPELVKGILEIDILAVVWNGNDYIVKGHVKSSAVAFYGNLRRLTVDRALDEAIEPRVW